MHAIHNYFHYFSRMENKVQKFKFLNSIFIVMCLFLTRAKSPQPLVDREDAGEKDVDKVRLNPCKFSDTLTYRNIVDT